MLTTRHLWLRLSLSIVLLSLGVQLLEFHGYFANIEGAVLDFFLSRKTPESARVVVLQIDDAAHQKCFQSLSPLKPEKLESLVRAVAATSPSVLGIDIFTDTEKTNDAYQRLAELTRAQGNIVWASAPQKADRRRTWFFPWLFGHEVIVAPSRILGHDPDMLPEGSWGVSGSLRDEDLRMRRFPRTIAMSSDPDNPVSLKQGTGFARQIAEKYCAKSACNLDRSMLDEVLVSFGGKVQSFELSDLLDCPSMQATGLWPAFAETAKGSVVLIGGSYESSKDFHYTPVGRLPGDMIVAYAIDSEIRGAGVSDTPRYILMLFDILVGGALVAIFQRVHNTRRSIEVSIALIAVIGFGSAVAVWSGRIWFTWIGVAVGVLIHLFWEVYHASKVHPTTAAARPHDAPRSI